MTKRIYRWLLVLSVVLLVHMPAVAEMTMRQVDQVLQNDPQNLAALFQKARLLEQQGQRDAAVAAYQQVIKLAPQRPEAYNNLAALYVQQGRLDEARKVLEQGMQTNSVYATMQKNLILINREMAARAYASAMVDVERPVQLAQVEELQGNGNGNILLANADDEAIRQEQERRKLLAEQRRQEELARQKAEAEQRRKEELARKQAEEEQRQKELLAQRQAEEQRKKEELAKKQAEEEQRRKEELARKQAEEQRKKEELAKKQAEEEQRRKELLAQKQAEEEQRRKEALAKKQAEEEQRRKEELAQKQAEEQRQRELLAQKQAEEQQRQAAQQQSRQQIEQSVTQRVQAWAAAWSAQDPKGYVAFYVQGYQPDADTSHSEWVQQRNARLTAPKWIKVRLENIQVVVVDANTVRVRFLQRYQSNTYQDAGYKQLTLVRVNGQWMIQEEQAVR